MSCKFRRATEFLIVACIVLIGVVIWSPTFGGIGHFSPDTLDSKSQSRDFLSHPEYYRDELTNFLIERGYWSPITIDDPRWILRFSWTPGVRDGESQIERELFWRRKYWIAWTEEHPDSAAVLWPRILLLLRSKELRDGQREVQELLEKVRFAKNERELADVLASEN